MTLTDKVSLSDEQTMALDCLIYCDGFADAVKNQKNQTVGQIVNQLEKDLPEWKQNNPQYEYNVYMDQEGWEKLLDYVQNDSTLCSLVPDKKTFKDNTFYNKSEENPFPGKEYGMNNQFNGFRALVFEDPMGNINDTLIIRGTATDWQWHDNFAPTQGIAVSPSQHEIIQYITGLNRVNLDISGHSKGGNLAETAALLLPNGMVHQAISYDGQRFSKKFMDLLMKHQSDSGQNKTININEYRDLVSKLFISNMDNKNSKYFTGKDYPLSDLFMYHKPDAFLYADGLDTENVGVKTTMFSMLANFLSKRENVGQLLKSILSKKMEGGWTDEDYLYAKKADEFYQTMVTKRVAIILLLYADVGIENIGAYFEEHQDSEVVDGAIIACIYCDVLGQLKVPVSHGRMTQGSAVAAITDSVENQNIIFEGGLCFPATQNKMLSIMESAAKANNSMEILEDVLPQVEKPCEPETSGNEWLITDDDKVVSGGGTSLKTVLLKSVLCCKKGGVISIVYNGQMSFSGGGESSGGGAGRGGISGNFTPGGQASNGGAGRGGNNGDYGSGGHTQGGGSGRR